tara:strand:- start:39 stop:569 length:531 start_codon:yes stop_codon:yes gene_type:complete
MKTAQFRPRKNKTINRLPQEVYIFVEDGACYMETNENIMGIELGFKGKAEITPEVPDNWILQGNENKMIIFTMENAPIKTHKLFSYTGNIRIISAVIANDKGERLTEVIQEDDFHWAAQNFDMSVDTSNWESYKDKKPFGKKRNTSYNLPDYNLPKVEKKTKIKRTQMSSRSTGEY